jgi:hypothetical protein
MLGNSAVGEHSGRGEIRGLLGNEYTHDDYLLVGLQWFSWLGTQHTSSFVIAEIELFKHCHRKKLLLASPFAG